MQEMLVRCLGEEDRLEKEMATYSRILAWKILIGRRAWWTTVNGITRVGHDLVIKEQEKYSSDCLDQVFKSRASI